jgi:hypothetical protein
MGRGWEKGGKVLQAVCGRIAVLKAGQRGDEENLWQEEK